LITALAIDIIKVEITHADPFRVVIDPDGK
jgi:hypothetical protein